MERASRDPNLDAMPTVAPSRAVRPCASSYDPDIAHRYDLHDESEFWDADDEPAASTEL